MLIGYALLDAEGSLYRFMSFLNILGLSSVELLKCKLLHCRPGHHSLGAIVRSTANERVKSILAGSI